MLPFVLVGAAGRNDNEFYGAQNAINGRQWCWRMRRANAEIDGGESGGLCDGAGGRRRYEKVVCGGVNKWCCWWRQFGWLSDNGSAMSDVQKWWWWRRSAEADMGRELINGIMNWMELMKCCTQTWLDWQCAADNIIKWIMRDSAAGWCKWWWNWSTMIDECGWWPSDWWLVNEWSRNWLVGRSDGEERSARWNGRWWWWSAANGAVEIGRCWWLDWAAGRYMHFNVAMFN